MSKKILPPAHELQYQLEDLLPPEYKQAVSDLVTLTMLKIAKQYAGLPLKGERALRQSHLSLAREVAKLAQVQEAQ